MASWADDQPAGHAGTSLAPQHGSRVRAGRVAEPAESVWSVECGGRSVEEYERERCGWDDTVVGVTGFGGGRLAPLCDVALVAPSHEYGPVEDVHLIVVHAVTAAVREALAARDQPLLPYAAPAADGAQAVWH